MTADERGGIRGRREYVTLRALGVEPAAIRVLISTEAVIVALAGITAGILIGVGTGYYFVLVLRPVFVLDPGYAVPAWGVAEPVLLVVGATVAASLLATRLVGSLEPTELLRDD